ncbi:MAG: hypothetical protein ABUL71_05605, partial [Gemmatimonadota bacterium]
MRDAGVSFLVGLGSALLASPAAAQLARLDHPGLDTARLRVLCSERAPAEHGARVRRQMVLSDSVRKIRPLKDPDLFDTLGCVNAMLYVDEPFVKPRDQTLRSPMAQASAMAFLQASELRPSDSLAAIGSATLAFEVTENRAFGSIWAETQRLAAASYAAVRAGVTAPIVLRMCAEFAIAAGDHATARHCLDVAYARGIDRSWNLERQALLAFMMGDEFATDGAASFDLAVSLARDSAARGEVGWHAAWLIDTTVTPSAHLLDAWRNSTDSGRVAWLHQQVAEHSATSGDGSPYVVRLARAFAIPGFLGGVIEQCPLPVTVNGFEQRRDRKGCLRDDVFPTRLVAVDAQLLRLWNPSSGEPVGVIGFGLGRAALRIDPGGRFDTPMTTVALTVRQFEWETAAWRDTVIRANSPLANDL